MEALINGEVTEEGSSKDDIMDSKSLETNSESCISHAAEISCRNTIELAASSENIDVFSSGASHDMNDGSSNVTVKTSSDSQPSVLSDNENNLSVSMAEEALCSTPSTEDILEHILQTSTKDCHAVENKDAILSETVEQDSTCISDKLSSEQVISVEENSDFPSISTAVSNAEQNTSSTKSGSRNLIEEENVLASEIKENNLGSDNSQKTSALKNSQVTETFTINSGNGFSLNEKCVGLGKHVESAFVPNNGVPFEGEAAAKSVVFSSCAPSFPDIEMMSNCFGKESDSYIQSNIHMSLPFNQGQASRAINLPESCLNKISISTNQDNGFGLNSMGCMFSHLNSINCDKNICNESFREPNPLEKLNEHIKSLDLENKKIQDQLHRTNIPILNNVAPIAQKENFKNCHKSKVTDQVSTSHERPNEPSDSFVYTELSNEETGFPEAFTGMVTVGKYISVKGDFTLRSSEALVESFSMVSPFLLKEPDSFPPKIQDSKPEQKDFFRSSAGELLIGIGLSRVNEWFHRDMARIKRRQIKREGKLSNLEEELSMHEKCYSEAKKANSIYSFPFKTCEICGFATESSIVMEGHLLIPHLTPRREFQCGYCNAINRDAKIVVEHMATEHGKNGRVPPPICFFECPYCAFESNSKVKLNTHLAKCQRYFDAAVNQTPPRDFEFPALTPKPITVAVVKAYEKSLSSMTRGRGRPKKVDNIISDSVHMGQFPINPSHSPVVPNSLPPYKPSSSTPLSESFNVQNQIIPPVQMPNMNLRPAHTSTMGHLRPSITPLHLPPPNRFLQVVNSTGQIMPMLGNNQFVTSSSQFPFSPNLVNSGSKKMNAPAVPMFSSFFGNGLRQQNSPKNLTDSLTITPLPKLQGPYPVPFVKPPAPSSNTPMQSSSLVVCEICDGYIKDLEQLRNHMQLIHKVKIHPKMLVSRPPLNCQKCQWRFFTDQGLERHLLGTHGLVTSNMQELANKGKDAGCCTICGRVYASKLVSHMNQIHKVTLKPAHLSYKCTVCSATFNLYRLFENHVYLVHSGAAKRPADNTSNPPKKLKTPGMEKNDFAEETRNQSEKNIMKDNGEENAVKCKECGREIYNSRYAASEKCEKCLKSEELIQGTLCSKTFM